MHQQGRTMARYVVPAIGGLCVTYLYNIVDGIFVGQGVGAAALGAVNIGVPFITFVVAAAAMFPMGGATAVAIAMGRGDRTGANRAFQTALTLTVLLSLLLMGVGMGLAPQVVALSGGAELSPAMEGMAVDYLFYYTAFSVPLLLSNCLTIFVRNDGAPTLSFVGMCAGAAANIFLDWLFIFPLQWGIVGAAVASGLGQVLACAILLSHFLRRRGALRLRLVRPAGALARRLCLRGLPEALSQLTTPVTALCYNWMLAWLVGDLGVSTFSVLSFLFSLANAVFSGVAQGLQPLWGQCHGQGKPEEGRGYFRRGLGLNLALAAGIVVLLAAWPAPAVRLFNQEADLVAAASQALPLFALSFLPMAANLIYTAYFYSTQFTAQANLLALCRGVALKALAICLLPLALGTQSIWLAPFVAELATLVLALAMARALGRKG